jgi:hypothetical protein
MEPEQQQSADALLDLARQGAALAAGLTVEQSRFLRGTTPDELAADARALATEFGVSTVRPPSGSGSDVTTAQGTDRGAERYRAKHPEGQTAQHASYTLESA